MEIAGDCGTAGDHQASDNLEQPLGDVSDKLIETDGTGLGKKSLTP
jgi:hypothetical protein